MLILSQDGKFLCNLEDIRGLEIFRYNIARKDDEIQTQYWIRLITCRDLPGRVMGIYQTEEEAKKELDRIAGSSTWKRLYKMGKEEES